MKALTVALVLVVLGLLLVLGILMVRTLFYPGPLGGLDHPILVHARRDAAPVFFDCQETEPGEVWEALNTPKHRHASHIERTPL